MAKQQLCTCITLFCTFLYDYHVKMPFFTFCEGLERKNTTFFPFSGLRYQLLTNWRRWNTGRDKVLSSPTSLLEWRFRSRRRRCCLISWCYTRRFAMMIFSATQHCNIVATLFRIVTTLFQHCNAVFPWKSSLRIVPCNPWKLKKWAADASLPGRFLSHFLHSHVISLHSTRFYQINWIPRYGYPAQSNVHVRPPAAFKTLKVVGKSWSLKSDLEHFS